MSPICPYCEKEIEFKSYGEAREMRTQRHGKIRLVCCPYCDKILGTVER